MLELLNYRLVSKQFLELILQPTHMQAVELFNNILIITFLRVEVMYILFKILIILLTKIVLILDMHLLQQVQQTLLLLMIELIFLVLKLTANIIQNQKFILQKMTRIHSQLKTSQVILFNLH